jgi:hypothetical protein
MITNAHDAQIFAFPEIAMMHQHCVRLMFDRCVQQRLTGGDATDQRFHLGLPLYLQAVWAVIAEGLDGQQPVDVRPPVRSGRMA